nr:MAG TPA: hypothetical protein [Caudoviricetes sp.]
MEKFQRFNFALLFLPSKNRQKLYVIYVAVCKISKFLFFAIVLQIPYNNILENLKEVGLE